MTLPIPKLIPLTRNKFAVVDADDYELLITRRWHYDGTYAAAQDYLGNNRSRKIYMHRLILRAPTGVICDHINRDPLDNRKANLRFCTQAQNLSNRPITAKNTSGFKGVSWYAPTQKWRARINASNKKHYLGYFATAEAAADAYNRAAKKLHGQFAQLNEVPDGPGNS